MKKYFIIHYSMLAVGLSMSLLFSFLSIGNIGRQLIIGGSTAVFYVLWGVYHHKAKGELHSKIVLEYVLIGLLAIILLLTFAA